MRRLGYVLLALTSTVAGLAQAPFLTFPLPDPTTAVYNGWYYRGSGAPHHAIDYKDGIKVVQGTEVHAAAGGLAISSCQPPLDHDDDPTGALAAPRLVDHGGFERKPLTFALW